MSAEDEVRIAVAMEVAKAVGMATALQVEHQIWRRGGTQYRKAAQTLVYKSLYENGASFAAYVDAVLAGESGASDSSVVSNAETDERGTGPSRRECDERLQALCSEGKLDLPEAGTQCSDCRSRDIKFTLLQTRAADEPMSVFCRCESCGKRWRM